MRKFIFRLALIALMFCGAANAAILNQGGVMKIGQVLYSDNGKYGAFMQGDGNFVIYRIQDMKAMWSTQTDGKGGTFIQMQFDGNFVMYNAANQPIWYTGTNGQGPAYFTVSEFGQGLVLNALVVWSANTSDNSARPGVPAIFKNGTRTNMTGATYTQNNGNYRLAFQADGNLALYKNGAVAWQTDTGNDGVTQAVISDSRLVMMRGTDSAAFSSPGDPFRDTFIHLGYLAFQPDGNLVMYVPHVAWAASSDDAPAPVYAPDPRCFNPQDEGCLAPTFPFPPITF
jgi:hypothetical protein